MIRLLKISDYDELISLWGSIDGVGLRSLDDSKKGIQKFLKRNPNTCFVYIMDDKLEGSILSGHDGRRGYIYHLAVSKHSRGNGIGTLLVDKAIDSLKKEDINKVALVVFENNEIGNAFWENYGFINRDDLCYRNMSINEMNK